MQFKRSHTSAWCNSESLGCLTQTHQISDLTEVLEETCALLTHYVDTGYVECLQQCKAPMFRYLKQTLCESHTDLINMDNRLPGGCQKGIRRLGLIDPVPHTLTCQNWTPTLWTFQVPEAELTWHMTELKQLAH